MAYLQARSNIARAGVTYAGYAPPRFRVYVNGTDRTSSFLKDTWVVTDTINEIPSTMRARVTGFAPSVGNAITVLYCTPDEYIFDGYIQRVTARVQMGQAVKYDIEASDATFRLDALGTPTGRHRHQGISSFVREWFGGRGVGLAHDGFNTGYIPNALGDVPDFQCDGIATISATLTRLAKAVGGYWRLNPGRRTIDIFTPGDDADGNRPGLVNTGQDFWNLVYTQDATQLRNSIYVIGSGGSAVSPVAAGATSMTVTECGWYSNSLSGGTVLLGGIYHAYGGPSVLSGTGVLGVTNYSTEWGSGDGLAVDVAQNDIPRIVYSGGDPTAANSWGGAMGSISGTQRAYVRAFDQTHTGVTSLGVAQLDLYKLPVGTLEFETDKRWIRPGQYLASSVTSPAAVLGTFVVQQVETRAKVMTNSVVKLQRRVTAGSYIRGLSDLLAKLA